MATAVQEFRGDANRAKVVQLRLEGKTLDKIAAELGYAGQSSVRYHLDAWLSEQRPSAEQTEELRQIQSQQLDALHDKLWPRLESDDYLAVTDRLVKLMDRKARLMGLDLQLGVTVNVITRESLADVLYADEPVIEGTAVEVTDA